MRKNIKFLINSKHNMLKKTKTHTLRQVDLIKVNIERKKEALKRNIVCFSSLKLVNYHIYKQY